MQAVQHRKAIVFGLFFCFFVVIGAEASSGHVAIALVVTGLGAFATALHGTGESSKVRPLLFALSLALTMAAIATIVINKAV